MAKTINLAYELKTRSKTTVWTLIGTVIGLNKWIADSVSIEGNELTFIWGDPLRDHETRVATVVEQIPNERIRLRQYDEDCETTIEMAKNEIAENYHLLITEEVDEEETDSIINFWNSKIKRLHLITGI